MRERRFIVLLTAALWLAAAFSTVIADRQTSKEVTNSVLFFDITDLPARIDEPKLRRVGDGYLLNCAIANRSSDQLFGLRLILMIVEPGGKLRSRITWNEESQVAPYSIKTFEFRPRIKDKIQSTDRLFLSVDEVIGRETIWQAVGTEKALRAYSRGQHDLIPRVRTVANKDDREPGPRLIPKLKREQ
jgi:hypothetical protein